MNSDSLGSATVSPTTPVVAGSYGSWTIIYTVGPLGMDSGGKIIVAMRDVSDWGTPQFSDPTLEGYSTVSTDGPAKLTAKWDPKGYIRPKTGSIVMHVYDGSLYPGDEVTITLGDRSQGSPGIRAQTYVESAFQFFVAVDPTNASDARPIADRVTLTVIPDEMVELVSILPSQVEVNRPADLFLKGEDRWRNPTPAPDHCSFEWDGPGTGVVEGGQLMVDTVGTGYLRVTAGRFHCQSNPIEVRGPSDQPNRYWGDLHAQTGTTVGVGSDDEYFSFGRDKARIDFTSHQGNDFQISDDYWATLNETVERYHADGRFVVFPGYEWSGSSPTGGDHNIFYRRPGLPILRSSHWLVPEVPESDLSPAHPADRFYAKMKAAVPLEDVIVAQHVGGRYANLLEFFDEELITLVEVVSKWGVFEWMLWDAFDKGYMVGVMANSDGHHGRPGAEGAGMTVFGIRNGLTCAFAPDLTRDALFETLKARRCYATTGDRLLLDFSANGQPMGTIFETHPAELEIRAAVTGTGPLESLQLFAGRDVIAEVRPTPFGSLSASNHVRVSWQGCRERGRQRRATWDGEVRVEGCEIRDVQTFSFDVVADGITEQTATAVRFASKTTGDRDGLDLVLTAAGAGCRLIFDSALGKREIELAELTATQPRRTFDFGGVDLQLVVERYPAEVTETTLALRHTVVPPVGQRTPYFVKATQVDGQMAWASPIWMK